MNYKDKLYNLKKPIKIAILGYGFMGSILYSQLKMLNGFDPFLVYGRDVEKLKEKFKNKTELPKFTDDLDEVFECNADITIDCTGDPDFGAKSAYKFLSAGRDVVSLNVETDSSIGPLLHKTAKDNDCIYSGIIGDEPGAIKELYDYASLLGFEAVCVGKGKNNPLDLFANPDTLFDEAKKKKLSPHKLTSFIDGTNTMIELCAVGNSIGFTPDIGGLHGVEANPENIAEILSLTGILKKEKTLEYVFGMSPGVFAIIKTDNPEMDFGMKFLKMGKGPNFLLYRPYHLTSMEVPKTLCQVYFERESSIVQTSQLNEVIALAKKDLFPGDNLDGIGGFTCYGNLEIKDDTGKLPIALIDKDAKVIKPVKKGEPLTKDNVKLSDNTITKLRFMQDNLGL